MFLPDASPTVSAVSLPKVTVPVPTLTVKLRAVAPSASTAPEKVIPLLPAVVKVVLPARVTAPV